MPPGIFYWFCTKKSGFNGGADTERSAHAKIKEKNPHKKGECRSSKILKAHKPKQVCSQTAELEPPVILSMNNGLPLPCIYPDWKSKDLSSQITIYSLGGSRVETNS